MINWLPIETAPKTGELIDVWCKSIDCEFRVVDVEWSPIFGCWIKNDRPLNEAIYNVGVHATNWMPIPKDPKQEPGISVRLSEYQIKLVKEYLAIFHADINYGNCFKNEIMIQIEKELGFEY